jgi:hypothetical protein
MNDAATLRALWMSEPPPSENILKSAVAQVFERDRVERLRERRRRLAGMAVVGTLLPVLIWASVYGVAPLVRGAYALMAVGCTARLVAEWLYLDWPLHGGHCRGRTTRALSFRRRPSCSTVKCGW